MMVNDSSGLMNITMEAFLRNTRDFAFVKDINYRYLGSSDAFAFDCVGAHSAESLIGKTDFEIFEDQELAAKYRSDDEKILSSGLPMIEYREAYPDKKGRKRFCLTTKYIIKDEQGNPAGIFGQCHDITEQVELEQIGKRQQLQLERQQNIFSALQNVYSDIMFIDFLHDSFFYVTGGNLVKDETEAHGSLSKLLEMWMAQELTQEAYEAYRLFFDVESMRVQLEKKGTYSRELESIHHGWLRLSVIPMEYDAFGQVITALLVDEHINDEIHIRGELEQRVAILNALYSIYESCMFWNLEDDTYFFVSGKRDKLPLDIQTNGVLSHDLPIWIQYDISDEEVEECLLVSTLDQIRAKLKDDGIIVRELHSKKSGWQRSSLIPVKYDEYGEVVSCLWVGESIDAEKKKELEQNEALKEAYASAMRANDAKTDFLSRVSHDIRTPLNAIVGMTSIAAAYPDDKERVKDCLNKIDHSSKHLITLINEVLDMSKIESGNLEQTEESFNLHAMMDEVSTLVNPLVLQNHHDLKICYENIEHEQLKGDKLHIQQVFTNILSNSIKYTSEGGKIRVTVSEDVCHQPLLATYTFVFEDNGIGMSKEYLEHIYEPFSREEDSRTNKILGTGLGMSIVMNIIKMMGGEIKVESEKGVGSRFTVVLHLKIEKKRDIEIKEETKEQEQVAPSDLSKYRVLIVEDQPLNMEIARTFLEMTDVQIEEAENGAKAVEMIAQSPEGYYDLVFMDIQMPVMNGYEATQEIRKLPREDVTTLPVIAMTANAFVADVNAAMQAGMNEHIAKPVDYPKFKATLDRWLNK